MTNVPANREIRKGGDPPDLQGEIRQLREEVRAIRDAIQKLRGTDDSEQLLTREETAECLRISTRTLDTMEAAGEIQAIRIRGRVLYHPDTVDAYIRRAARGGDGR